MECSGRQADRYTTVGIETGRPVDCMGAADSGVSLPPPTAHCALTTYLCGLPGPHTLTVGCRKLVLDGTSPPRP